MANPTVVVEIAFTAGASTSTWLQVDDAVRGRLDTGTLAPDETWTDVSEWVITAATKRGSMRVALPLIRYDAGTATIVLDNSDRRFDPANLTGPYVSGGVTQITPMRAVRVRALYPDALTSYDLFRGFADEWRITYSDPGYSEVTLTASDAFKVIGNIDRAAGGSVGAGEDSGARVNRILDSISWSATDRQVADGDTVLQATTLNGDALAELQLVADTEIGELYVDGAGRVVFRNRDAILTDPRSLTPQATFGDGGGTELAYENVEVTYDDASFANYVRATRAGGAEQVAQDSDSQALYLTRTLDATGLLMQDDASAADWAAFMLRLASQPELRFASATISPNDDPDHLWPQVLMRQIGDRLTVTRRPPGGGSAITRDVFVRGIDHEIGDGLAWRTIWTFQSATRYAFLVLDDPTLGQLDSNALAY